MIRTFMLLVLLAACTELAGAQTPREVFQPQRELGYAQAIRVGNTIYVSGTVARGATMEEQVEGVYRRIAATLAHFGATASDIVRETAFTTDIDALERANAIRKRFYGDHTPTATWVQISRLLMESALVEIEVTAVLP